MAYNMSAITNATSVFSLYEGVNAASGNLTAYFTLAALFVVLTMILLRNSPPQESILASSLVCLVTSLGLLGLGLVNTAWPIGFTLIAAFAAVALYLQR